MSYEYRTKPPPKDGSLAFSFPCMDAELSAETIKSAKIGPALRRIGKQLVKQYSNGYKTRHGSEVVGVEFHRIGFTFILDTKKKTP